MHSRDQASEATSKRSWLTTSKRSGTEKLLHDGSIIGGVLAVGSRGSNLNLVRFVGRDQHEVGVLC